MSPGSDADRDCPRCPRLVAFRETWRTRQPEWYNSPVASFGSPDARLLIVGLAPGLQGANRTGRLGLTASGAAQTAGHLQSAHNV